MVSGTRVPQGTRLNPRFTFEVTQGMSLANAIANADALTGDWTILLYPGVYDEGDITPTGGANITIRGMGDGRVEIAPVAAPVAGVIVSGNTLCLENVIVRAPDATMPPILVNGGVLTLDDCDIHGVGVGDAIAMTNGQVNASRTTVHMGDIDLSTNGCILNMYFCRIVTDPIDTAGVLVHQITLTQCDLNNQGVASAATGATTLRTYGCSHLGLLANAGTGNWECRDSDVGGVNFTNTGTLTLFGGDLSNVTRAAASVVWWRDASTIIVLPSGTITDTMITYALAAAAVAGGRIEMRLAPGEYEEDSMNCVDGVIIVGAGHTVESGSYIRINSANTMFTCGAVQMTIRQCRVIQQGAGNCLAVNSAAAVLHLDDTIFGSGGNSAALTAGTLSGHSCTVTAGNIDLSIAACTIHLHRWSLGSNIVTAGAFNHVVDLESCNLNGNSVINNATGATTIDIIKCFDVNAFADASLLGTVTIEATIIVTATKSGTSPWAVRIAEFGILSNTNAAGAITCYAGLIYAITRAIGPIVWWQDSNTLKVIPSGTTTDTIIQWAVNAAAAGDVILLHPGTYEEQVACKAGVDLKGVGPKGSVIIYQLNADIITLADNIEIDNLTVRLGTPDAERHLIEDNAVACTARLTNLVFEITAPTNIANLMVFYFTGAGNYTIERCFFNITYTGAAVGHGVHTSTNAATLHLFDNDFTYLNNASAIHVFSAIGSTVTGGGNRWAGTAQMFSVTNGTITLDNEAVVCTASSTVTGGTVTLRTGHNSYEVFPGMQIQHAVGAGRYIYLHPGTYTLTAILSITVSNITIQGAGRQTILTTATDALKIIKCYGGAGTELTNVILRDFLVRGFETGAGSGDGIEWVYVDYSKAINIWSEHNGLVGFRINNCDYDEFDNVHCYSNTQAGWYGGTNTWIKWIGCSGSANAADGTELSSSSDCQFIGCTFNDASGATRRGIVIVACDRITIVGCCCDNNNLHGLYLLRCDNCSVTGGQYNNNGDDGIHIAGDATANCDYNIVTGVVATGNTSNGIEISEVGAGQANKNIVLGNQLLGNTAAALVDGGTNTEIGHNITV